jgi:hypothetical protein
MNGVRSKTMVARRADADGINQHVTGLDNFMGTFILNNVAKKRQ